LTAIAEVVVACAQIVVHPFRVALDWTQIEVCPSIVECIKVSSKLTPRITQVGQFSFRKRVESKEVGRDLIRVAVPIVPKDH